MWTCPRSYSQPAPPPALLHLFAGRGAVAAERARAPGLPAVVLSHVSACGGLLLSVSRLHHAAAHSLSGARGATIDEPGAVDHIRSAPSQPVNGPPLCARAVQR